MRLVACERSSVSSLVSRWMPRVCSAATFERARASSLSNGPDLRSCGRGLRCACSRLRAALRQRPSRAISEPVGRAEDRRSARSVSSLSLASGPLYSCIGTPSFVAPRVRTRAEITCDHRPALHGARLFPTQGLVSIMVGTILQRGGAALKPLLQSVLTVGTEKRRARPMLPPDPIEGAAGPVEAVLA